MKDSFFVEFSRENYEAAEYELLAVQRSAKDFEISYLQDEFALLTGSIELVKQCSFVNSISRVVKESENPEGFCESDLPGGSFYIRVKDYNGCHNSDFEPHIGKLIQGGREVTFRNPDFKVRAIHAQSWYLTVIVYEKDKKGMEARRAPLRPFFSPVAIHPRYARYLVNITETLPGETVLDPFCGTGGILIEAGLMGRRILGNDFSLNMVKGARLNLKYFSLKESRIYNMDVAELVLDDPVDGIATDLPYGRNSNMKAESVRSLYETAFSQFHDWLKPGGIAAVILSDKSLLQTAGRKFKVEKIVGVPQHKSLTRYFVAMRKTDRN